MIERVLDCWAELQLHIADCCFPAWCETGIAIQQQEGLPMPNPGAVYKDLFARFVAAQTQYFEELHALAKIEVSDPAFAGASECGLAFDADHYAVSRTIQECVERLFSRLIALAELRFLGPTGAAGRDCGTRFAPA